MAHVAQRRKKQKPPIEANLELLDWGPRGATRAEFEGRHCLVDRGIPGEAVSATLDRRRKPWRGVVDRVERPSPDRIVPPCPYYARQCGGCQWQHMGYEAQLRAKRELVDRELRNAGMGASVAATHSMEEPWRYRRTAAIAIGWEAGFRPRGRRGIVEIHDCLISHPLIGQFADQLNGLLRAGQLPNYHGKVWLDCTVIGTETHPCLQVVIQGIQGLTLETHPELLSVAERVADLDGIGSVAYRHRTGEPKPLTGDLFGAIEVRGRMFYVPAGSFFQTNLNMLERVLGRMEDELLRESIGEGADIYGGVGTFGLALAHLVDRMTLVELDAFAVEAAARTARLWGLSNVTFVSRHAEKALPDLPPLDLAIVDPPRSGLGTVVVDTLIANPPALLFYVSCSPPSLARDLAALSTGGFSVESIEMFDFYPQTYHAECFSVLRWTG